jgi:glutamyl/glutaminyl-tRNA synthetase
LQKREAAFLVFITGECKLNAGFLPEQWARMEKERSFKKTRLAPTPSGYLHLGNVLSFALTAALARRTGASILLRIDDMDKTRAGREYVQDIFDTLNFLEIPWDEGPRNYAEFEREFSQLHRLDLYRGALQQLQDEGKLFACTCSRTSMLRDSSDGGYPGTCRGKKLPFDGEDTSWRLMTEGVGASLPAELRDFIVRKKDGLPAYQLASVMDDLHFGVDLVVRGQDLWPSTLAQHFLARQLRQTAFGEIRFYHHPLLVEPAGTKLSKPAGAKLSKSAGAASILGMRGQGLKPADIYSMIARMTEKDFSAGSWQELVEGLGGEWVG